MAGVTIEQTFKEAMPMLAVSIGVLFLVTFVPSLTLWLPRLCGY